MSNKVAPRVQLNFAPEDIIEENSQPSCDLDSPVMPIDIPEVIERDEIVENDIFLLEQKKINEEQTKELIISEVSESEAQHLAATPLPQKKQTKNKTKRKLSEDHKAKLALAREKALITRRKNAEEKKRMKQIEKQTKELKKKKAQKDLEQLEDEVINADKSQPRKSTPVSHGQTFTKEDLENASLEAIMKYETIRKARKEEKKKQQMIDQQKKDLQKKIQGYGARDTNGKLINRWNACY